MSLLLIRQLWYQLEELYLTLLLVSHEKPANNENSGKQKKNWKQGETLEEKEEGIPGHPTLGLGELIHW